MNNTECVLYVTVPNSENAELIGRDLLDKRLAACINILMGMCSLYRWQGSIERSDEVVLLAKTRTDLIDKATSAIVQLHDYETPCVVALPILGGSPDFLRWIQTETT